MVRQKAAGSKRCLSHNVSMINRRVFSVMAALARFNISATKGFENCPERGARCSICFTLRLMKTALYAKSHGFDYFTSTLAFSRWKSLAQVDACGSKVSLETGVPYLPINWRKCGIQETSRRVIRENNLYEQNYCGCVYSYNTMKSKESSEKPSIE